jgi:hypothetical protein
MEDVALAILIAAGFMSGAMFLCTGLLILAFR